MHNLQLDNLVQQLRLLGIADSLKSRLRQARDATMSYEELLLMLFQDKLDNRNQSSLQRRVTQAKFIKEKNHVIIMGPVGTGKTHLSQALGMLACQRNKKVKFIRSNELLNEFYRSRADFTYDAIFKRYTKVDLLILDDFGLKTLSAEQSSDLYDLIAAVHINASLIITTNRKIETCAEIFFDPVMANAALDRIVNNSYKVVLEGDSYQKNFTPKFKIEDDNMIQKS